jgi:hypothetical protein
MVDRLSTLGRSAQICPGRAAMETSDAARSLKELLGDLTHSITTLFRKEIEHAGAEISCPETSTFVARRPRWSVEST